MQCKNCGIEHDGIYGGKYSKHEFCSKKCTHSFCTKDKRQEINEKVSITFKNKFDTIGRKNEKCTRCGQYKDIGNHELCKKYRIIPNLIKYFGFDNTKIGTIEYHEELDRIVKMLSYDY